jgi:uncharacterized protein YndB with AHSA1/START domain
MTVRPLAVDHQYFIRSPPGDVFRALTDPAWIVKWLADTAELDPRTGGRYHIGWKDGPQHVGTILNFIPGQTITFAWEWEGIALKGTEVRLTVEPSDGGSILRVAHTGFPRQLEWMDLYGGAEWGWTYFAMNLKSVLETGHDLRARQYG